MTRHRFINDGRSPIPMGAAAEYACVCGRRGSHAAIARHIAEQATEDETTPPDAIVVSEPSIEIYGGEDTQAHYLPMPPREPAPISEAVAPALPPPPRAQICPTCGAGTILADLPEIATWSCGHWITTRQRSIAEAFQDMLRAAYQAGVMAAASGETFETWYQREVLQ